MKMVMKNPQVPPIIAKYQTPKIGIRYFQSALAMVIYKYTRSENQILQ